MGTARPLQSKARQKRTLSSTHKAPTSRGKRIQTLDGPHASARNDDTIAAFQNERRKSTGSESEQTREAPVFNRTDLQPAQAMRSADRNTPGATNSQQPMGCQRETRDDSISPNELTPHVVLEMLRSSEKRIMKHIVSQQRVILARVEDVEAMVKDIPSSLSSLKSSIGDMKLMILPNTNNGSSRRGNTSPRNNTRASALHDEVVSANPTLRAELEIVFGTNVACVAAGKTIVEHLIRFHRKSDLVSITARMMHIMLYSVQNGMRKAALKHGVGYRHAEFRFKIAGTVLDIAKTLPETLFVLEEEVDTQEEYTETNSVRGSKKTSWLSSDFVDAQAMSLARKHNDFIKSDVPADPSSPQKRKALFIGLSIYKVVIGMLHDSRDKCRSKMFEDGMYCLLDWKTVLTWFPSDLCNPTLTFLFPEVEVVPPSSIPDCSLGKIDEVGNINNALLQDLISERREMLVEVTYDVYVTPWVMTEDGRKTKGAPEMKNMRRVINILQISKAFICGFCHVSESELLRTHPKMLECLYRFALVIRDMILNKIGGKRGDIEQRNSANASNGDEATDQVATASHFDRSHHNKENNSNGSGRGGQIAERQGQRPIEKFASRKDILPITLKQLVPSESERDRIIQNAVNLSPEGYRKYNVPLEAQGTQRMVPFRMMKCLSQMVMKGLKAKRMVCLI